MRQRRSTPRKGTAAICAAVLALPGGCVSPPTIVEPAALSATERVIDDSYTVSQRYDANRAEHSEISQPVVDLDYGGRILFERRYKVLRGRELHADVFLPASDAANGQAIVLVHGGAWRSGNKSNFYPMAAHLARRGYAVILPEYRLAPEAIYPAGLIDINDAIAWTRAHSLQFGIDPARIAVGGESSGGQMASLIAFTGAKPLFTSDGSPSPRVNALIDIDGVLDFTSPLALQFENAAGEKSVAARWLGGAMERVPDKWKEASAATHLDSQAPPTLIISGEADRFTAGRDAVLAGLAAHGIPARHAHFEGLPHTFWLFDPYLGHVVDAIDTFMRDDVLAAPSTKTGSSK